MANTFTIEGKDAGLHRVRFEPSGEVRLITDEELEELSGGKTVKRLDDDKEIERLRKEIADLIEEKALVETDLAVATEKLAKVTKASEEWQLRAETAEKELADANDRAAKAEATVAENKAAKKKAKGE